MNLSKSHKDKIALSKIGERNPMWKGKKVGYNALHGWVKRHLKKPKKCLECKNIKPLDLANISQKYKRDLSDWEWLCRKCHMTKDGRLLQLKKNMDIFLKKHTKILICPVCKKREKKPLKHRSKTCSKKCGGILVSKNKEKVCRLRGHLWSKKNTYITPKTGFRMCIACRDIRASNK